jgi:molecular chaperone GrpE
METETSDTDAHLEDIDAAVEPDPVEILEAEVAELKDKLLRQAADMENLRRRTEREKQDMAKFAITNFAKDIVTLDDNLTRTLSAVPEGAVDEDPALKALVEGVEMTGRELTNVLERHGIKRIDPKGEIFDPNSHQALFEIPNPEITAGTILEVVAPGFTIDKRVLRPAMVGIAKGGKKPSKEPKVEEETNTTSKADSEKQTNEEKVDKSV